MELTDQVQAIHYCPPDEVTLFVQAVYQLHQLTAAHLLHESRISLCHIRVIGQASLLPEPLPCRIIPIHLGHGDDLIVWVSHQYGVVQNVRSLTDNTLQIQAPGQRSLIKAAQFL